jgi:rubrerythrin
VSSVPEFSFDRLDVDGALAETAHNAWTMSRAGFLAATVGGSAAVLGLSATDSEAQGSKLPGGDVAILNYALTLEHLQASFYTEAQRARALKGDAAKAARVVGAVERAHVEAFGNLLGRKAVKRPKFDFQGTTEDQDEFLKTAVAFEDLAVAAYKGQAVRVRSDAVLAAAVAIHSVEARHASWMRYLVGADPAGNAFDEPKSRAGVNKIVRSTNFVTGSAKTTRKRRPGYAG